MRCLLCTCIKGERERAQIHPLRSEQATLERVLGLLLHFTMLQAKEIKRGSKIPNDHIFPSTVDYNSGFKIGDSSKIKLHSSIIIHFKSFVNRSIHFVKIPVQDRRDQFQYMRYCQRQYDCSSPTLVEHVLHLKPLQSLF